jgi:hypothetical protein
MVSVARAWLADSWRLARVVALSLVALSLVDHLLAGQLPPGTASLAVLASSALGSCLFALPLGMLGAALGRVVARPGLFRVEVFFTVAALVGALWFVAVYLAEPRLPMHASRMHLYYYGTIPSLLLGFFVSRLWRARAPRLGEMLGARALLLGLLVAGFWALSPYGKLYLHDRLLWLLCPALVLWAWPLRERRFLGWAGLGCLLLGIPGAAWLASSGAVRDDAARGGRISRALLRLETPLLAPFGASLTALAKQGGVLSEEKTPATEALEALEAVARLRPRNIILITVDALRADLGGLETAPNFARLRRESLVFEHAYSPANNTIEAVSALFFGRYFYTKPSPPSLAALVTGAGWHSIAIHPSSYLLGRGHAWIEKDFSVYSHQLKYKLRAGPIAEEMTTLLLEKIDEAKGKKVFVWVHYNDPHAPYDGEGETAIERYQSEVARVDTQLGRLLDALNERGELENSLLVVTADHGEEFGEHGGATHGLTLYEESIRVPFFVRAPRAAVVGAYEIPISLMGLPRFLAEAAGVSIPTNFAPGESWRERWRAPLLVLQRGNPTTQTWDAVLRWGNKKFAFANDVAAVQLYDLATDPGESHNLAGELPREASAFAAQVQRELARLRAAQDPEPGRR